MNYKKNYKIDLLKWHLDFISKDLDQMDDLELSILILEARYYLRQPDHKYKLNSNFTPTHNIERNKKNKKQPKYDGDTAIPTDFSMKWNDEAIWKRNIKNIQAELKDFFISIINPERVYLLRTFATADLNLSKDDGSFIITYSVSEPKEKDEVLSFVEFAKISLCHSLNGILCEAIKTCKECGKYFYHISKKPKFYCNQKCTSRALSRKRREADPEGYRKIQREIMRKKYGLLKGSKS
ncbi:MAG: hypothetical protein HZA77_12920 [Candidatus Schekmanbacteria bacterium]|nr:hypothetical protein [Candidatus Schekmanbacteria bacterium]